MPVFFGIKALVVRLFVMKHLKRCLGFAFVSIVSGSTAYAQYAIPGCENAWNSINAVGRINALAVLIRNDCAVLHRKGWRLGGGNARQDVCTPAWNALVKAGQVTNVKFMVTHNCPVFYRKGWVQSSSF